MLLAPMFSILFIGIFSRNRGFWSRNFKIGRSFSRFRFRFSWIRVWFSVLRHKRAGKLDYERFASDEDVRFYDSILKFTARNAGISKNECTAFCVPCDFSRLKSSRDSRSFIVGAVDCFSGVTAQRRGRQDGCDTGAGSRDGCDTGAGSRDGYGTGTRQPGWLRYGKR